MAVDRPTFNESWYRVAHLRPRLRAAVQSYRQQFRGKMWHVLDDPSNNQFFRLDEPGYELVALLDGRKTVAEAWSICNERLGDAAPTQGETIRLLGQLYTSNLMHGDLPPDARRMLELHRKRRRREVGGYLMNFLFVRIPLLDPNRLLQQWVRWFGWAFGPVGLVLWVGLMGVAFYFLAGRFGDLWRGADPQVLLRTENLVWLYACFAAIKALHELGHGFACAHFGRREGAGGAVHTLGIMLLVFMPVPYVDASSSYAFRSKWRRAFVGAAGMYVELAVAAVAAIVWAHTASGTLANALSYNLILIASVSTLLFNGNPLLRFDGYYILSDLLEMPNLTQRSRRYLHYLVKRYCYGVRAPQSPAHGVGERWWLAFYAIASMIYRVFICIAILLYIAGVLFVVGVVLAAAAVVTWVFVPLGKFIKYLGTHPELERVRGRAVAVTVVVVGSIIGGLGLIPAPDRGRAEGVVEPVRLAAVHMAADGFITSMLESETRVSPDGPPVMVAENYELEAERRRWEADRRIVLARRDLARGEDPAVVQALDRRLEAVGERVRRAERQLADLEYYAPFEGVWVSRDSERLGGVYLRRGERVGLIVDPSEVIVRVTADQGLGPRIEPEVGVGEAAGVELRVRGRPDIHLRGRVLAVLPAGQVELPSAALGYMAGGQMSVAHDDPSGRRASEPFFEAWIAPEDGAPLRAGQRVVVRFTMGERPLLAQWWRAARQLFQRRFSMGG